MKRIMCVFLCVICAAAIFAQEDSHYRAAEKLVIESGMAESYPELVRQILDQQIDANPMLAEYRQIMLDFFEKYMGFDAIRDDLIRLYMQYFSEKELLEIAGFYATPTGKKAAKLLPQLFQEGSMIGQRKAQEHIGELQAAIEEAMRDR